MNRVSRVDLPPFQDLLDAHGAAVLRLLVAMVGRQDADDAWQETFAKAWAAYPSLTSSQNLAGWLFAIARRVAIDAYRTSGRVPVPTAGTTDADVAVAFPLAPFVGGSGSSAGDPADSVFDAALWQQVDALPPKQRAAVVYRYVGDLPYDDIAALMGCSAPAARRSAHEGVRRLRQEVAR